MQSLFCIYTAELFVYAEIPQGITAKIGNKSDCDIQLDGGFPFSCLMEWQEDYLRLTIDSQERKVHIGDTFHVSSAPKAAAIVIWKQTQDVIDLKLSHTISLTIGRAQSNDLSLPTKEVSSNHAEIKPDAGGFIITDKDSTNHTYVNGKVISSCSLCDGDEIFIAGWLLSYNENHLYCHTSIATPLISKGYQAEEIIVSEDDRYPFFSRSPRVQTKPLDEDITFLSPQNKQDRPNISLFDSLAPSAFAALSGIGLIYAIPNTIITMKNFYKRNKGFRKSSDQRIKHYFEYLEGLESFLIQKTDEERKRQHQVNPALTDCLAIAQNRERRLWERSTFDADYLTVRVGLGEGPSGLHFQLPHEATMLAGQDELLEKPREFQMRFSSLPNVPVTVSIKESVALGISGPSEYVTNCVGAIISQIATHHPYDEVKLVCLFTEQNRESWEWIRWLPHIWDDEKIIRYMASKQGEINQLLKYLDDLINERQRELEEDHRYEKVAKLPYIILVITNKEILENQLIFNKLMQLDPQIGIFCIFAYENLSELPNVCEKLIECEENRTTIYNRNDYSNKRVCIPDKADWSLLDSIARSLAPIRVPKISESTALPACVTFLQGYGVKKAEELDVLSRWKKSRPFDEISVPIGVKNNGESFLFDLHENALGPHGLVAGTTGFGKSELLQTWLLSVATNYRPDEVSFVLIDFKGEGFAGLLRELPHVAGVISNIDITGIKRNLTALTQELVRRQEVFRRCRINSIYKYQKAYREKLVDEPMAHLIIVIDEFAQLKKDYPDYMDTFISTARIGRSLGVHLVLATQSPGGIVDEQVLSNTRFRICLKTANVGESREMLGTPDASNITVKGRAIVQAGNNEVYEQIQTYWSGASYMPNQEYEKSSAKISFVNSLGVRIRPEVYEKTVIIKKSNKEEIDIVVDYIAKQAKDNEIANARKIWEEPLPSVIFLEDILSEKKAFDGENYISIYEGFAPMVGVVDAPDQQTQYPLVMDVAEGGHIAIYGAPRSGKTTWLQTFIISTAMMYTPEQVVTYVMDFGAWSMKPLEILPGVGGVANGNDAQRIEKLVSLLEKMLAARKAIFSEEGVGNIEVYREVSGKSMPYVALVVDNFESVLNIYPELDDFFIKFVREGSGLGMFLVLTSSTLGINYKISQSIKQSVALQMVDKADYVSIVGKTNGMVPTQKAGRGLIVGHTIPYEFQTALGVRCTSEAQRILIQREVFAQINQAWTGERPAAIPIMPSIVLQKDLNSSAYGVEIGLECNDVSPVHIKYEEHWNLLISGVAQSGKTNMLCLLLSGLIQDEQAQIVVYESKTKDTRLEIFSDRIENLTSPAEFDAYVERLIPELQTRKNKKDSGEKEQLHRIAILIDDYETCFEKAQDQTIVRLRQIVKLGKGLAVNLYITGDNHELKRMEHMEELIIEMINSGRSIVLGASIDAHPRFRCNLTHSEKSLEMGEHEGYLLAGNSYKFKAALAEDVRLEP